MSIGGSVSLGCQIKSNTPLPRNKGLSDTSECKGRARWYTMSCAGGEHQALATPSTSSASVGTLPRGEVLLFQSLRETMREETSFKNTLKVHHLKLYTLTAVKHLTEANVSPVQLRPLTVLENIHSYQILFQRNCL